jgi:hypothetical protein
MAAGGQEKGGCEIDENPDGSRGREKGGLWNIRETRQQQGSREGC